MDNDLVEKENWLKRNWKWFLPSSVLILLLFVFSLAATSENDISDIALAYSDHSLYEKAIDQANLNLRVLEIVGKIKPIDKLAILEGNTSYSNNKNSVDLSIRINGAKRNGKLDISASKKGSVWEYKKISVRTKNPKEEIIVLDKL
ncbi:cytochrome c oxidase assembly factor Coa1 family protein [Flavobacterium sp. MC2016-06]|uniref:cytochrome c oxidase assembly factor Coa1 family protein n=1 Tax=Flavobacterium sp. MC2016-06 TaxID=2676308 RepID=UPI0012BB1082|nr:cytochrome c oxidase assembly factor Coa1 family protein [Flavobacterium sp. MC2016-06]MBU3860884.1 hypothetical protein [Flavobacterium sp. MC2016-06]